jgi:hypothetical protein
VLRCLAHDELNDDDQECTVRCIHESIVSFEGTGDSRGANDLKFLMIKPSLKGKVSKVVNVAMEILTGRRLDYHPQGCIDDKSATAL